VCFLGTGRKPTPEYGILARAYDPDFDTCCTCMRVDGSLHVYGYKEIDKAIARLNNKDAYCPLKQGVPKWPLANMLKARKNEGLPLGPIIAEMEELFLANLIARAQEKKASVQLVRVNKTPRTKKKKATSRAKKTTPRRTHKEIGVGTELAMYYYDMEMDDTLKDRDAEPPEHGAGHGKWYRGRMEAEKTTNQNKLVFHCFFDTPLAHQHWHTEAYTAKAMKQFLNLRDAEGWTSAPTCSTMEKCLPTDAPAMKVGDFVTRWFTTPELPANYINVDSLRGAYVDGMIIQIDKGKITRKCKCSFDAPVAKEIVYSEKETQLYYQRYLDRKPLTEQTSTSTPVLLQHRSRGARQQSDIKQACAVVSRPTRVMKKVVIPESQGVNETVGSDLNAAFKAHLEDVTVDDMTDCLSPGSGSAELDDDLDDDLGADTDDIPQTRPDGLYQKEHRQLRTRSFPCSVCGDAADGSHQCGRCFAHVHVICAPPFPGSEEGYGQVLLCSACTPTTTSAARPQTKRSVRLVSKLGSTGAFAAARVNIMKNDNAKRNTPPVLGSTATKEHPISTAAADTKTDNSNDKTSPDLSNVYTTPTEKKQDPQSTGVEDSQTNNSNGKTSPDLSNVNIKPTEKKEDPQSTGIERGFAKR
jgi:hypothetical protein